jgi:hypothetical protein
LYHRRVVRESEIIVAAEIDQPLPVAIDMQPLRPVMDPPAAIETLFRERFELILENRTEHSEQPRSSENESDSARTEAWNSGIPHGRNTIPDRRILDQCPAPAIDSPSRANNCRSRSATGFSVVNSFSP